MNLSNRLVNTYIFIENFNSSIEERIKKIKNDYLLRQSKDKEKAKANNEKNPFLKGENLELVDFMDDTDVSSSCLICHK